MSNLAIQCKTQFPFFRAHPEAIYLDSAATTQLPQSVIDTVIESMIHKRGNPGRGSYPLAQRNVTMIESVRSKVATFLGTSQNSIYFTSGATDSFNRLALGCLSSLPDGAEVLYAEDDHASLVEPWIQLQALLQKMGRKIVLIPYGRRITGSINLEDLISKLSAKSSVVLMTHIHNVYGTETDIDLVIAACRTKAPQSITICDATQSVGHIPVDVTKLGVDALCFSGHKIGSLSGVGVTYLSARADSFIAPLYAGSTFSTSDSSREFGSAPTTAIASLGTAIDFLNSVGIDAVDDHLSGLTSYALNKLRMLPEISFSFGPHYWSCEGGHGILSFTLGDVPSSEIGLWLAENNIFVRTGSHCINQKEGADWVRLSMYIYNDTHDIDALFDALQRFTQ